MFGGAQTAVRFLDNKSREIAAKNLFTSINMIRMHTTRDANLGHLSEKSGITPRGKFINIVKESDKYRVSMSQVLFFQLSPTALNAA